MTTYKKIYELERAESIKDTDLFVVETDTGTKSVTIDKFKANDSIISSAVQAALDTKVDTTEYNTFKTSVETTLSGVEELLQTV